MSKKYLGDNIYAHFAGRTITLTYQSPMSGELNLIVFEPQTCQEFITFSAQTLLRNPQVEAKEDGSVCKSDLNKSAANVLVQDIDAILRDIDRLGSGNAAHLKNMLLYKLAGMRKYLVEVLETDDEQKCQ